MLKNRFAWLLVGVFAYEGLLLAAKVAQYTGWIHPALPPTAERQAAPLEPQDVNASWILEGKPEFRSRVYASSPDKTTVTGIWECVGPGKFMWRFDIDESVYVLEGKVHVEYKGEMHTLGPGDKAFFPAGVTAVWTVPERIKKSFTLHEPGRVTRFLRRLL